MSIEVNVGVRFPDDSRSSELPTVEATITTVSVVSITPSVSTITFTCQSTAQATPGQDIVWFLPSINQAETSTGPETMIYPAPSPNVTKLELVLENSKGDIYSTWTTVLSQLEQAPSVWTLNIPDQRREWGVWTQAEKGGLIAGAIIAGLLIFGLLFFGIPREKYWIAPRW